MARRRGISVRQRRVSAELRALRERRGLSCKDVARALDCSESKVSRMETGDRGLFTDDVAAILGFLRAPAGTRQELLALVRDGEERNWHELHGKLPTKWTNLIRIERDASAISNYEPLLFPGLTQTPEYARQVMHGIDPRLSDADVDALVAARLSRQAIIGRRNAPHVHLIMDEMVLRRTVVAPEVIRAQLHHLLALSERQNIAVQVVPINAAAHPGLMGSFVLLEFTAEPTLVHVESRSTGSFLEEDEQINTVRLAWRELRTIALSPEDSARLIATAAGELTSDKEHGP